MKKEHNESFELFKKLIKEYLENNKLKLDKEIWNNYYSINKSKGDLSDYTINRFAEEFVLPKDKNDNYHLLKYIERKNSNLYKEIVKEKVTNPKDSYSRKEYYQKVFSLYTDDKKNNVLLWNIVQKKSFLNNNIDIVKELFEENLLSHIQKKEIVEYYFNYLSKNGKFSSLENKRIVTLLNDKLIKPLEINVIEKTEELTIISSEMKAVYLNIKTEDLISREMDLNIQLAGNLLRAFRDYSKTIDEFEIKKILTEFETINTNEIKNSEFMIMTNLSENVVKKIFTEFVKNYVQLLNEKDIFQKSKTYQVYPDKEDIVEILRFSVIKARKESLEESLSLKNIKSKTSKI